MIQEEVWKEPETVWTLTMLSPCPLAPNPELPILHNGNTKLQGYTWALEYAKTTYAMPYTMPNLFFERRHFILRSLGKGGGGKKKWKGIGTGL